MSKRIGTIEGCDIVEQDDGSITFTAAARLDGDGANGQFGHPPGQRSPETFLLQLTVGCGFAGVLVDAGDRQPIR